MPYAGRLEYLEVELGLVAGQGLAMMDRFACHIAHGGGSIHKARVLLMVPTQPVQNHAFSHVEDWWGGLVALKGGGGPINEHDVKEEKR